MTSYLIWFLWNLNKNLPKAYLSGMSNFCFIRHKRAEIYSREDNRELWRKKGILSPCDLDLWPKVTNFNRVWASAVSNHLAKTTSKSVHPFGWNFVHCSLTDRQTHTHTHKQTNCNENIIPPSWRCKKKTFDSNSKISCSDKIPDKALFKASDMSFFSGITMSKKWFDSNDRYVMAFKFISVTLQVEYSSGRSNNDIFLIPRLASSAWQQICVLGKKKRLPILLFTSPRNRGGVISWRGSNSNFNLFYLCKKKFHVVISLVT